MDYPFSLNSHPLQSITQRGNRIDLGFFASFMEQMMSTQNIVGIIKDKASQGKAVLSSRPRTLSLHLPLLRATDHTPFTFPIAKHLSTLLSVGNGSRATASSAVGALMDRLQRTRSCAVALKCLVAVHHIIKHGSFIMQDQLSVYPSLGGRNYLNLSNFRDKSNPICWVLSSWVRWYAQYIEQLLCTSRTLGFYLGSSSCTMVKDEEEGEERVWCLMNWELIREIGCLTDLVGEFCGRPEFVGMEGNRLLDGIVKWTDEDYVSSVREISVRMYEFNKRIMSACVCVSFGEALELLCLLKRLEEWKEKTALKVETRKGWCAERFWGLVREWREEVVRSWNEESVHRVTVQ